MLQYEVSTLYVGYEGNVVGHMKAIENHLRDRYSRLKGNVLLRRRGERTARIG